MSAKSSTARRAARVAVERCELCGDPSAGSFIADFRHLRQRHPLYARGLVLRMTAPLAFLVAIGILAVARAPQWVYLSALALGAVFLVQGKLDSRRARKEARLRPAASFRQLMRDGGFRFLLLPAILGVMLLLSLR